MMVVYSVREAAERLGLSQNQVRYLLAKGEIQGKKLGHDWAVLSLLLGSGRLKFSTKTRLFGQERGILAVFLTVEVKSQAGPAIP